MSSFSIGISGIRASRQALDVIANNVTNANTPGYHRQVTNLAVRTLGSTTIGNGVVIKGIGRLRSSVLENAIIRNNGDVSYSSALLESLRQIESFITPGQGALADNLEKMFNGLQELAARPDDLTQRRVVLASAASLARNFNTLADQLDNMTTELDAQLAQHVDDVNRLSSEIARLNQQIAEADAQGLNTNAVRDQRDQFITELSQLIDIRTFDQDRGLVNVVAARVPLVVANQSTPLEFNIGAGNTAEIRPVGSVTPMIPSGGAIGGLLAARNAEIVDLRNRSDQLAQELIRQIDGLQTTGLPLSGPMTSLTSQRLVSDTNLPLDQAGLAFPPQAGTLTVSVTDLTTGDRVVTRIAIDPAVDSLQDVATALNGIANLQATVDPAEGSLTITGQPGYAFDFAGRLPSDPTTVSAAPTSTSAPVVSGSYQGSSDDNLTLTVLGSGSDLQVGVDSGLSLEVRDGSGSIIGTFNIGQGYEANSALELANGLAIRIPAGVVNPGDTYSVPVTSSPDSAGILTALGLNSFFVGSSSADIRLHPNLEADPASLAAGTSAASGDASNLLEMVSLRDQPLLNGNETFREFLASAIGGVGSEVRELDDRKAAQSAIGERLLTEQQSVSGVDPNEELVYMLEFQRQFQMSSEFLAVVNRTLDSLFRILQ
ncbi:MAG: flagellar hook-associated protein FlgK [Gemmatales bacterium]|nr:MAG: flagellar hook-associated protein FlgK [Gemmatales bacterium]